MSCSRAAKRALRSSLRPRYASSGPADIAVPPAKAGESSSLPIASTSASASSSVTVPRRRRRQVVDELSMLSGTRDLVGPPDPLSNLRPVLPACPAYASHKTSLYAPKYDRDTSLVTHPYEISEVGPTEYNLDTGLEEVRQGLEHKEVHWRLLRHRQETLAQDFWSAMNARFRAERQAAEAEGVSEEEFLRIWVNQNGAVYRAYDKEWNYLLKRSLWLGFRAWRRDLTWRIESASSLQTNSVSLVLRLYIYNRKLAKMTILGGTLKSMVTGEPPKGDYDMRTGHVDPRSEDFPNAENSGDGQQSYGQDSSAGYGSGSAGGLQSGNDSYGSQGGQYGSQGGQYGSQSDSYGSQGAGVGNSDSSYGDSVGNRQYQDQSSTGAAGFGTGGASYGQGDAYDSSATAGGDQYGSSGAGQYGSSGRGGQYTGNSGTSSLDDVSSGDRQSDNY